MFYKIQTLSLAGAENNEDAIRAESRFLFVIDGATGLGKGRYTNWPSDAAWFAQKTADILAAELPDDSRDTLSILVDAMSQLKGLWPGSEEAMPSGGIAVFRIRNQRLEYFGLGDCSASVILKDDRSLSFEETRLTALDRAALDEMVACRKEQGCSMREAREFISGTLMANRALRNTPEGYWCLDPSGAGLPFARQMTLPLKKCQSVFLCTDGYAQLIGFGEAETLLDLHKRTLREGVIAMTDRLFALQEGDVEMTQLPRFKFRDDTTVIAAKIR